LICIRPDGFEEIRRTHGEKLTDQLLKWLATMFFADARTEDTVARIGESEFGILALDTDATAATAICARLCNAVSRQPFHYGEARIPITLDIGVASLERDRASDIDILLRLARTRLDHPALQNPDEVRTGDDNRGDSRRNSSARVEIDAIISPEPAVTDSIEAMSVSELEDVIRREAQSISLLSSPSPQSISVDSALQLLMQGNSEALIPHLPELRCQLQPLLKFYRDYAGKDITHE